jgi:hypothetical protein
VNTAILALAMGTVMGLGFLAVFVLLLIGMRAEGSVLSPSSAPHTRLQSAARRFLGVYVRRQNEQVALHYEDERR